jgi:ATP-dependent helicase Lhr and Lhr-like helicase
MAGASESFELLHPLIQRWIYDQGWTELRDAQEKAAHLILSGATDVIIAAATAAGKTEAAFLPICSRLLAPENAGAAVLYVSPLKALINDQTDRMERLCEHLQIPVHPWHGDIAPGRKREFLKKPAGLLLITPESLEAIFVRHGWSAASIFPDLRYIIVDELHCFIGTERGQQLQSLLNRVEQAAGRRIPRIALSATLGDMKIAAEFVRPGAGDRVAVVTSQSTGQELKLLLRGYATASPIEPANADVSSLEEPEEDESSCAAAADLLKSLRGSKNLVFANSRRDVEKYADHLRRLCEAQRLPNEFWAHHGNLSKEIREDVEAALKDAALPATAICTSTLELGIDIGAVRSVAQVGSPPSVASLRQRLGRSGRRGEPAVLRIYITESAIDANSGINDLLRVELIQTIAMVNLLLARWCEPPDSSRLHLSTLIQQMLSTIAQFGGATAKRLWAALSGAFVIDAAIFGQVLRALGDRGIIRQESDGTLLLDSLGERIVDHYSFYAAFTAREEYRIVAGGKTLGTLPIDRPLEENSALIFAGRRWRVVAVDEERKTIEVHPASGGRAPSFTGDRGDIHDRVRREMLTVYTSAAVPPYLDSGARHLLAEGRRSFCDYALGVRTVVPNADETMVFTWMGDRVNDTLAVWLRHLGLLAQNEGPVIRVSAREPETLAALGRIAADPAPGALAIARKVPNKLAEKYDALLGDNLLNLEYASRKLDIPGAQNAVRAMYPRTEHPDVVSAVTKLNQATDC